MSASKRHVASWALLALLVVIAAFALPAESAAAPEPRSTLQTAYFEFDFPERATPRLRELVETADSELQRLGQRWGAVGEVCRAPRIRVVITANRSEFDSAQLSSHGAEPWMAATAYPARDLIVMSLEHEHFFRLEEILRHEISHVALYRAAGGRMMPRWLDEGMAIVTAGEDVAERLKAAAGAALTGRTLPFSSLERGFPRGDALAKLAYAQSATFCRWLTTRYELDAKLPDILADVRAGVAPMRALDRSLALPVEQLEAIWQSELSASWTWLAVLTDAGAIWSAAAVIAVFALVVAFVRRRRKMRAGSRHDEEEEAWPPSPLSVSARSAREDDWLD